MLMQELNKGKQTQSTGRKKRKPLNLKVSDDEFESGHVVENPDVFVAGGQQPLVLAVESLVKVKRVV